MQDSCGLGCVEFAVSARKCAPGGLTRLRGGANYAHAGRGRRWLAPALSLGGQIGEELVPEAVVMAFIEAMHAWEVDAWAESRRARGTPKAQDYLVDVSAACDRVFARFCTARKRPQGRNASFSRPPEYDPATERVVATHIDGNSAVVDTLRAALLGGAFRYRLRRHAGAWLIDSVKREQDGAWIPHIL